MELIQNWDPAKEQDLLAPNFYLDLSRDKRVKEAEEALNHLGEILSVGPVTPENQLRGSFLLHGTQGNAEIFFTLTPEPVPKVQWLSYDLLGIEHPNP
jgi:hypothetical protein